MRKPNNKQRKGFTIVELVIVIAVVAVLAGVMIPTFGGIIKRANISADEQLAASLTTVLHTHLMTEKIENEAELVEALEESGVAEQLILKNTSGYHFWFNIDTQRIEVLELKEVKTPTRNVPPANTSFRDLYDKGLFLIDYTVLSELFSTADITHNVFSYIDDLAVADQYANLIAKLGEVTEDHLYYEIAVAILEKVHNTTIRTEAGAFFSAEGNSEKFEYFSAEATFVGNGYHKYAGGAVAKANAAPTPAGIVAIPDHIDLIVEDGLIYDDANSNVQIDRENIGALSPGFTNSNVIIDENTYKIPESNPDRDELVNKADPSDIIPLTVKVPFEEIVISYENKGAVNSVGDRIYVAFRNGTLQLSVANKNNISQISNKVDKWELIGIDNTNGIINEKTGLIDFSKIDFGSNSYVELNVKANAKDVNENSIAATATVVIAKPQAASLTIQTNSGGVTFNSADASPATLQLSYNGELTSYVVSTSGSYGSDSTGASIDTILGIVPEIDLTHDNFIYEGIDKKLVFKATASSGTTYAFSVKADNAVDINVSLMMVDASQALFTTDFHYDRTPEREYHIGSANGIKLSDLYDASEAFGTGAATSANVTFYDKGSASGKLFSFNTANNDITPTDITTYVLLDGNGNFTDDIDSGNWIKKDSITITKDDWNKVTVLLDVEDRNTLVNGMLKAYVEIVPSDNSVSTVTLFKVVDGAINVTDINDLKSNNSDAIVFDKSVVLQDDCDVGTGTTIDIGENKTLYGNGYKINATTYVASGKVGSGTMTTWKYECQGAQSGTANKILHALTHSVMKNNSCKMEYKDTTSNCDYYDTDAYMIKLDGGTIDNIYINGPVYPTLQYHKVVNEYNGKNVANTPYYVSGVKASAGSNILNSYVFGFRQAVEVNAAGGSVAFDNSTIEGGSYANIHWIDGNMSFNDVTTVQNSTGYTATVNGSNKVVGMGVAMDATALDNKVTVTGYLNQYNWVSKESGDLLPVIDGINLGDIFDYVFDGILGRKMGSVYFFVHEATDGKEYVNAGFVFIEVGKIEDIAHYADSGVIKNSLFDDTARESGGSYAERKLSKGELSKLSSLAFNTEILGKSVGIDPAKHITGKDAKIGLLTYRDGRNWTVQDNGLMGELVEITTDAEKANVIKLGNVGYEINYTGYYTDYGN